MSNYRYICMVLIAGILSLAPLSAFAAEEKKAEKKAEKDDASKKPDKKKSAKKKKKKKKKDSDVAEAKGEGSEAPSSTDLSFVNFLPFGVGQFAQGKYLIGSTFAASEALLLFLYVDRTKQVDLSNADAQKTIDEVNATGEDAEQEVIDYLASNEAYVEKTKSQATLALAGFFGLYAIGVAEAIFDPFGLKEPETKAAFLDETEAERSARIREVKSPKLGMILLPDGSKGTYGFSLSKRFD